MEKTKLFEARTELEVAFANGGRKPGWRCLKIAIEIKAITA
jgi:hypothetical protein